MDINQFQFLDAQDPDKELIQIFSHELAREQDMSAEEICAAISTEME